MNKKSIFLGLLLVIATIFIYFPSLKYHFYQDDYYTLLVSQAQSLKDILRFFTPGNEIYYRPLSMRVYFWFMQLFKAKAIHFHSISLLIHIINSMLVWKLIKHLSKINLLGWLSAFLYATSSIHFINLYWISEIGLLMGICFYLLSVTSYIKNKLKSTLTFFIFGLLSHEYLVTLPASLTLLHLLQHRSLKKARPLIKYWLISAAYLFFRLVLFPVSVSGTYAITFGKSTIKAAFWYLFWSLNVLENLKDQLLPGLSIRSEFMQNFPIVSIMAIVLPILFLLLYVAAPVQVIQKLKSSKKNKAKTILIFSLSWIIINLSIPLVTPDHIYPIYFSLSLIGLVCWISYITLSFNIKKFALVVVSLAWFLTSLFTTRLTEKIHWTVQEANKTHQIASQARKLMPNPPSQSTFVIRNDYQTAQALYDQDGLRYEFNNPTINTYYGKVASITPDECKLIKSAKIRKKCLADYNIYVINQ